MLIFHMDINICRNVGVVFCILASEHPVNPILLVAVMWSGFIIQVYKSLFLPDAHIEVVRTTHTDGSDWHRHCDFLLVLGEYGRERERERERGGGRERGRERENCILQ
jgi:hypothetical protein